jgi:hypothetical protein
MAMLANGGWGEGSIPEGWTSFVHHCTMNNSKRFTATKSPVCNCISDCIGTKDLTACAVLSASKRSRSWPF